MVGAWEGLLLYNFFIKLARLTSFEFIDKINWSSQSCYNDAYNGLLRLNAFKKEFG